MGDFLLPPALRPGDVVRIIAPSGPFDPGLFEQGVSFLAERYQVQIAEGTLSRSGFLAGSDAVRTQALAEALAAPDVRAIVAARGGYGATRIMHRIQWRDLRRFPKWVVGFSDITALHLEAQAVGVCSLHADNVAGLGCGDERAREEWLSAIESPAQPQLLRGLAAWRSGDASGPLCGGNLTVLFSVHAAGRMRLPKGAILALEDVTEAPYRIDRMLSALLVAGVLDDVAGVVLGDFSDCAPGAHGVAVEEVLRERLGELQVPLLAGAGFGHGGRNVPLPFGLLARINGAGAELVLAAAT